MSRRAAGSALAFGLVIAFVAPVVLAQPPSETPASSEDVADILFAEATRAMKEGQTQIAYEKLKLAWDRKKSMDIAANLALLERELGKKADAAQHLEFALRNFPPTGNAAIKQRMSDDLAALEKEVARVTLFAPPGATVRVDGRAVELNGAAILYVDPGARKISATHPALGDAEQSIDAQPGVEVVVRLEPTRALPPKPPPPKPDTPPPESRPFWPGILGFAVGAVGVGVGVGLIVASEAEADAAAETGAGLVCDPSAPSGACVEVTDSLERRNALGNGSIAAFAAGGAALVFGTIWFAIPPSEAGPSTSTFRVRPVATREVQGLWVELTH